MINEVLDAMDAMAEENPIRATGQYPSGKLCEEDEDELRLGMAISGKTLIINFGKKISWLGLEKEQVDDLIAYLTEASKQL